MQKRITVLLVAMLALESLIIIVPNHVTAANEKIWIPLNQDIKVGGGYPRLDGYIKVNVSDVICVNWISGALINGQGNLDISVLTSTPIINYSDKFSGMIDGEHDGNIYTRSFKYGEYAPQSDWLRVGSYDVVEVYTSVADANAVQTINFTVQKGIPDIYAMNNRISNLTTNLNALNASMNASINALNETFTNALDATNNLLNMTNVTITANLTKLWSSFLDSLTTTNNQILSNYNALMNYTNQSLDIILQNLNTLDDYSKSLNISYQENMTLIQAFMDFTNASITLLNADLTRLNDNETYNVQKIITDLNELKNYTNGTNAILVSMINLTNINSTNRDDILRGSIDFLQNLTENLTKRATNTDIHLSNNDVNDTSQKTYQDSINGNFNDSIKKMRNDFNKQISDTKKENTDNLILGVSLGVISGAVITISCILIHNKWIKKRYGKNKRIEDYS